VTLSGTAETAADRDKAIDIARKVEGVRDVKSTLQVKQSGLARTPFTSSISRA